MKTNSITENLSDKDYRKDLPSSKPYEKETRTVQTKKKKKKRSP